MVNTVGLNKSDILHVLGYFGECSWEAARPYKFAWKTIPNCWCAIINQKLVFLDLRADDGFDETPYDEVCGPGSAQRAIDMLRLHYSQTEERRNK